MKKLSIFIFSLMVASFTGHAQQEQPTKFAEWAPKPAMHPIPVAYFKEHAVVLLESEVRDYKFEGKDVTMYSTVHRIVKVLDRRGIEEFNTITIPFRRNESRVDSVKARVVLPNGTTHDLTYEMLYIGDGGLFFALDGVEPNAEIEILVKYKALSSYFGSVNFQYGVPVLNTYFELNYPKEMFFNTKGYHGFPSGHEEIVGNHKQIKIFQADIPALENQPYSFYDLYRMRLEYGIDHMVNRGGFQRGEDYTYDKLAQNMYTRFYDKNQFDKIIPNRKNIRYDQVGFKESDKRIAAKFLTSIGIKGTETDKEKIKMIEDGIKTNIVKYWELSGWEGENLDTIVSKKSASAEGIVKLFCACFHAAGINHELGKVSDRREHLMDPKFINWAPLQNYVFYFPDFDSYMAPDEPYYRYPEVPYSMINNKGIFCRTNPETGYLIGGDVAGAEAIVRTITQRESHLTNLKSNTEISISKDLDVSADITRSYTGYAAADLRLMLAAAPKEKIKDIIREEIMIAEKPEDMIRYSTSNESFSAVYQNKPLIVNAIVRTPYMIEKAGNRYLLNVGDALGHLPEMYDKNERVLPVDLDYAKNSTYTITVNIPEGYKVTDAHSLHTYIEQTDKDNGNTLAYFKSDYTINGKKLVVTISESYPKLHYSVRDYQEFRKIMNASADFNKAIVVLEKEKVAIRKKKTKKVNVVAVTNATGVVANAKKTTTSTTTAAPVAPTQNRPVSLAKPTTTPAAVAPKTTPKTVPVKTPAKAPVKPTATKATNRA